MASGTAWLKGCGIGCGLIVILGIVGTIGGGLVLMKPFKDAVEKREVLEERFGAQEEYRPPLDGVVARDRMEVFLAVRSELMEHCAGFEGAFEQFRRMEDLDDEETSGGTKFREVLKTIGQGFGMAGKLGRLAGDRNVSLAEHGMGLGEYSYIYAVAYYAWLEVKVEDLGDTDVEVDDATPRVRRALREMLRHQHADLTASAHLDREALLGELSAELERLGDDRSLYPWEGNVPAHIADALAPYRGRLEAAFCPATTPFALSIHQEGKGGLSIRSD